LADAADQNYGFSLTGTDLTCPPEKWKCNNGFTSDITSNSSAQCGSIFLSFPYGQASGNTFARIGCPGVRAAIYSESLFTLPEYASELRLLKTGGVKNNCWLRPVANLLPDPQGTDLFPRGPNFSDDVEAVPVAGYFEHGTQFQPFRIDLRGLKTKFSSSQTYRLFCATRSAEDFNLNKNDVIANVQYRFSDPTAVAPRPDFAFNFPYFVDCDPSSSEGCFLEFDGRSWLNDDAKPANFPDKDSLSYASNPPANDVQKLVEMYNLRGMFEAAWFMDYPANPSTDYPIRCQERDASELVCSYTFYLQTGNNLIPREFDVNAACPLVANAGLAAAQLCYNKQLYTLFSLMRFRNPYRFLEGYDRSTDAGLFVDNFQWYGPDGKAVCAEEPTLRNNFTCNATHPARCADCSNGYFKAGNTGSECSPCTGCSAGQGLKKDGAFVVADPAVNWCNKATGDLASGYTCNTCPDGFTTEIGEAFCRAILIHPAIQTVLDQGDFVYDGYTVPAATLISKWSNQFRALLPFPGSYENATFPSPSNPYSAAFPSITGAEFEYSNKPLFDYTAWKLAQE